MKTNRQEFTRADRESMWNRAQGRCEACGALFQGRRPHYDHVIPLALYGRADVKNGQCICKPCHSHKTITQDMPRISKAKRLERKRSATGIKPRSKLSAPPKRREIMPRDDDAHVRRMAAKNEAFQAAMRRKAGGA